MDYEEAGARANLQDLATLALRDEEQDEVTFRASGRDNMACLITHGHWQLTLQEGSGLVLSIIS